MNIDLSRGLSGLEETSFLLAPEIVDDFIIQSTQLCESSRIGFPELIEVKENDSTLYFAKCGSYFDASELYQLAKKLKKKHNLLVPYDTIFDDSGKFTLLAFDPWRVDYDRKEERDLMETMFDEDSELIDYDFRPFLYEKGNSGKYSEDSDLMKLYNGARMAAKRQVGSAAILFR